jgi:hypothetical protein
MKDIDNRCLTSTSLVARCLIQATSAFFTWNLEINWNRFKILSGFGSNGNSLNKSRYQKALPKLKNSLMLYHRENQRIGNSLNKIRYQKALSKSGYYKELYQMPFDLHHIKLIL